MAAAYTIQQFDSKHVDFSDWVEDFISLVKITNCPDANLKHLLRLYLDAPAKRALNSLTDQETADLDTLVQNMKRELTPMFVVEEAQDALEHLNRGSQEVDQFGYLVKKTVSRAYPSMNAVQADQMARKYFIKGLGGELRKRLEIRGPSTLDAAIKCALQQERFLTVGYVENRESDLKKELTKIQYELKVLQRQQENSTVNNSNTQVPISLAANTNKNYEKFDKQPYYSQKCQLCNTSGHIALTCRKSPVSIPAANKAYDPLKEKPSENRINHLIPNCFIEETIYINKSPFNMLVDSGSSVTIVPWRWVATQPELNQMKVPTQGKQLTTANGSRLNIQWKLPNIDIQYKNATSYLDILVAEDLNPDHRGIMGIDALQALGINISFAHHIISTHAEDELQSGESESTEKSEAYNENCPAREDLQKCFATQQILIPPNVQTIIEVENKNPVLSDIVFEHEDTKIHPFLKIGNSLLNGCSEKLFIPCLNMSNDEIIIPGDTVLGHIHYVNYEDGPDTHCPPDCIKPQNELKFDLEHLPADKKQAMQDLLFKNKDVFSTGSNDLGRTWILEHEIDVQGNAPIRQYLRRKSPEARKIEGELIDQMLKDNIIRPSNSPWASPILLTKKKDGSYRFCIDFRKVNAITKKDSYPLCNINEALETLKGSAWFTSLDLMSGFWQVPIKEQDKEITAFTTGRKLYQFEVLPFGMCNSPSTFSRLMEKVLEGLQWQICLLYIDDILIFAKTYGELLQRMQAVFDKLRYANLKLKP